MSEKPARTGEVERARRVFNVTFSVAVVVSHEPRGEADPFPFVARCPDLALSPRRATAEGAAAAVHNAARAALLAHSAKAPAAGGDAR